MKVLLSILSIFSIFSIFFTLISIHAEIDPSWVRPHDWGIPDSGNGVAASVANKPTDPQEKAVTIFYKKLVRNIFKRQEVKFDENSNQYVRVVRFELTEEQLDILHRTEDVYTLDLVVSQILLSSKTSKLTENFNKAGATFAAVFHHILGSTEIKFILVTACILSALWYIVMKNNYSWMRTVFILICLMVLFGYLHTYYECNKELEVEELLKLINENDPCKEHLKEKERSWFWNLFLKSKKQECEEHIRNLHKAKLPFCRPDKVLLRYINDITFHQIEEFLARISGVFQNSVGNIGIINTAIGIIVFAYLLNILITPLSKYFFKYLLSGSWSGSQKHQERLPQIDAELYANALGSQKIKPAQIDAEPHWNAISGENLSKFLSILHSFQETKNKIPDPSGVEILQKLPEMDENNFKAIKMSGPSNVRTTKPLPIDNLGDNDNEREADDDDNEREADDDGNEREADVEQTRITNDIKEDEHKVEPNKQETSQGHVEKKIKVS